MVWSGNRRLGKSKSIRSSRANNPGENKLEFLARELPPRMTKETPYFANALSEAGKRYDRYAARRKDWNRFAPRRNRLQTIAKLSGELVFALGQLDILSSDDLASRIDPKNEFSGFLITAPGLD